MSPAADVAEVVLPARVEAPSPFDSLVPAMAVVETLVAAVTEQTGVDARRRLAGYEQLSTPGAAD
jgi:DNA-binding MurR/RpiR family transcriptional regulator